MGNVNSTQKAGPLDKIGPAVVGPLFVCLTETVKVSNDSTSDWLTWSPIDDNPYLSEHVLLCCVLKLSSEIGV